MKYAIIIPVYRSAASLLAVIERLHDLAGKLDGPLEGVFVVDGSPDDSAIILRELLPKADFNSKLILHSRNFGSFAAIRTGIEQSSADYVAVMAADLQEPEELYLEFFRVLANDEADIAVGQRTGRDDPGISAFMSRLFWASYRRFVFSEMPAGGVDVFACSRPVASELVELKESNSSLVGLLYWVGFRRAEVPYHRAVREHGRSSWSFKKKVDYLLDSVFSFSQLPLTILVMFGAIGSLIVIALGIAVLVGYSLGAITEPGYTPLMLVILFSTFMLLSAVGIVGSYVWRAFENTKSRPQSVVMRSWDFTADA